MSCCQDEKQLFSGYFQRSLSRKIYKTRKLCTLYSICLFPVLGQVMGQNEKVSAEWHLRIYRAINKEYPNISETFNVNCCGTLREPNNFACDGLNCHTLFKKYPKSGVFQESKSYYLNLNCELEISSLPSRPETFFWAVPLVFSRLLLISITLWCSLTTRFPRIPCVSVAVYVVKLWTGCQNQMCGLPFSAAFPALETLL